jgi:hypothetical protein
VLLLTTLADQITVNPIQCAIEEGVDLAPALVVLNGDMAAGLFEPLRCRPLKCPF